MEQTCEKCNCTTKGGSLSLIVAALALVLFLVNTGLVLDAQATQRTFAERQAQIQQGLQVDQLNRQLIQALGAAQIQGKDKKIEALLGQHGITVTPEAAQQPRR